MTEVGEAFVRVRANTTGFKQEAEGTVAEAGRDLGKTFVKAFAIGGIAESIKSVVEAATEQNNAFVVLDKTLKNAGLSAKGFSSSLHDTLEVQARATGVSAEDLADAMSRIVPATGSVQKSVKDLNTALGISETYHIDLSTAALALAKAETGSYTSLQRYLGKIPEVTTAEDRLRAQHDALTASGAKLDASQKVAYASALKVAHAQDSRATSAQALAAADQKFAGVAQANAQSYEGQFQRLEVAVDQLKVAVGTELVKGLADGAGGLADFIGKLIESEKVQEQSEEAAHNIGEAFHAIGDVLKTVGPPLLTLADDFGGVTKSLEGLAAAAVVSKIVSGLTAVTTAETAAGDAAVVNATKIDTLRASLGRLALIGAITIPIEILLNKDAIDKDVTGFLKDNGLGFTTGTEYGSLSSLETDAAKNGGMAQALLDKVRKSAEGSSPEAKQLQAQFKALGQTAGQSGDGFFKGFKESLKTSIGRQKLDLSDSVAGSFNLVDPKAQAALESAGAAAVKALRDGITSDETDLAEIKSSLADAIKQGAQAVADAVNQAKQNLNSIGASLASDIQAILVKPITTAQQQITDAQDKLSLAASKTTLRKLGDSVYLPGGKPLSSDPDQAIAQLKALERQTNSPALLDFIQQYQSAALGEKSADLTVAGDAINRTGTNAATRISNLTDLFNTKKITGGTLDRRVSSLLSSLGITPAAAGAALGVSGADTLSGLERGLREQAGALSAGPQRAGSGLVPSITRPLDTLNQTNKQIASIAKQQRDKQIDEAKKQTKLLTTIAGQRKAAAFTSSLDKNPGTASKKTAALAGT